MKETKLFALLPEYISTPDSMAFDAEGKMILTCPNFADESLPGCVVKIDKEGNVTKWFDVPVLEVTGQARPMGIAVGPDGSMYICDNQGWSGNEAYAFHGRILRIKADKNGIVECVTVASGMEHPNGIKIKGNYMYVTQSLMTRVKNDENLMVSAVYRFALDDENIAVTNTLDDKQIIASFVTYDPDCQYGLDGIIFDSKGDLFVGNFGDGSVHKIELDENDNVVSVSVFAHDKERMRTTDGMAIDENDTIYVTDFSMNAIAAVYSDGRVERIAQSGDCDGFNGELDQPCDVALWDGKLIVSCFDTGVGGIHVNTKHEMPATMCFMEI